MILTIIDEIADDSVSELHAAVHEASDSADAEI